MASSAGNDATTETRYIIDMPTAGTLRLNAFAINIEAFTRDGVELAFEVSPFKNFSLGLAMSGTQIIGAEEPNFQSYPGVMISYRFLDETLRRPALKVGFNSQGTGYYDDNSHMFESYSPGLYIAASKNFVWWAGQLALHGGINYSIEPKADDRMVDAYLGLEQSVGPFAAINLEYVLGTADNPAMNSRGLVNASVRFSLTNQISLELAGRDLLNHLKATDGVRRTLRLEIISSI